MIPTPLPPRPRSTLLLSVLTGVLALSGPTAAPLAAQALELSPRPDETVLAVITLRDGAAARLAHNHLVLATDPSLTLRFDPMAPEATTFQASVPVEGLVVDDPARSDRLAPRIVELGILPDPPGTPSEGDREKIRNEMRSEDQLDAAGHPLITARLLGMERRQGSALVDSSLPSPDLFPWLARVELTVAGTAAVQRVAARHEWEGGVLTVEATGVFRFTDFGIEPYSAFLGLVKVADPFHLYLHMVAESP